MDLKDLKNVVKKEIIHRTNQIDQLIDILGGVLPPALFIYGQTSTGKSLVVQRVVESLGNIQYATIHSIECLTPRFLYESILEQLGLDEKCDNPNDFARHLKLSYNGSPICIVVDKAERMRDLNGGMMIPMLFKLQEFTGINIGVVLISEIPYEKFRFGCGSLEPIQIFFPQYTKDEILDLLKKECDINQDPALYSMYLSMILGVFLFACRDLWELRYIASQNFDSFMEPIITNQIERNQPVKLWRHLEPKLRQSLNQVYLRGSDSSNLCLKTELPFFSKFLIIAAYLASYNPAKYDRRLFVKAKEGRKNKGRGLKSLKKQKLHNAARLMGPKVFPIYRLMAIFYSIVEERVTPSLNIFVQISYLSKSSVITTQSALANQRDKSLGFLLKQLVSSENTERMEGLGKGTAVWKMGGPSGAEENESESGARQQSSLLTSIGREVKMALANSGRKFSPEEVVELREQFNSVDLDNNGFIELGELKQALDLCGFKIPQYQVRQMIDEVDRLPGSTKGHVSFEQFEVLCAGLKSKDVAATFKQVVTKRENLETIGGMSAASSEGTTHSVRMEEQLAFSGWINSNLGKDAHLKHLLPIDKEGRGLFDSVKDGILLCKIINHSCPDTIDDRAINMKNLTLYTKHENLTLALYSAQSIGCNIVNIDAHDLTKGKPHLVLGLLWQIIRIGLFNQITLEHCPGLTNLLRDGERIEDLMKLSPEAILLRWVNYQLERAGTNRRCNNFTNDITDAEVYSYLLNQIAPNDAGVTLEALRENNPITRAEVMLQQANKLGCRSFVTPEDVVNGVYKLNLAFVANLFNNHPALNVDTAIEGLDLIEETREEKTYRNWMNSLGVNPYVNWIYSDLADGLVIFQLYDIIRPGIVNWSRVTKKFSKLGKFMEMLENCNYVVELGKELKFSLVGIAGKDLNDGNPTLTLALIWQLMRAYTLSVLAQLASTGNPIVEKEIVDWVNKKLASGQKQTSIRNFQDSSIADARVVIDLIDCIKPGTINYELLRTGGTDEDNLANAKYAISMARKVGARVYALPEDIAEVKMKMVMTVFATLMARDYVPNMDSKPNQ